MAFCKNVKNVGISLFLKNDEILILPDVLESNTDDTHFTKLKCEPSVSVQTSNDPAKNSNKQKQSKDTEPQQNIITSAAVSNCNTYIAAGDVNNSLHIWKKEDQEWKFISVRSVVRKCQKILFTNCAPEIIVADRGGDVFCYSVSTSPEGGKFLLGHICLILDMAISSDDKYLATCDRDGKVRVSHYPNCYNILSYCLGHREFVSSVLFMDFCGQEVLVSSSGDGMMNMWNFVEGKLEQSVVLRRNDKVGNGCDVSKDPGTELLAAKLQSEGNLALSEEQFMYSVRSLNYSQKHKTVGVLFHFQSGVRLYRLVNDNGRKILVFKQFLPLDQPPLDAMFTNDGDLYVLTKKKGRPIFYFKYGDNVSSEGHGTSGDNVASENSKATGDNKASGNFLEVKDTELSRVKYIQEFYKDFEQIPFQDDFVSLFKRVYDDPDDECTEPNVKKNKAA